MEQFIRTITSEEQRAKGKTVAEGARGVLARLANTPDGTVSDLGGAAFQLRENDDRDAMVAAVRAEAAKLARFTEVVEEPVGPQRELSPEDAERTLSTLEARFKTNTHLHEGCEWSRVKSALEANTEALWSISQMEAKGHMPDVYDFDGSGFEIGTCSEETPESAKNCVYDAQVVAWLKENRPNKDFNGSAVEMAKAIGIGLMSPAQYRDVLQSKGKFDMKTSSWLLTDEATRAAGRAFDASRELDGNKVYVIQLAADTRYSRKAWRGSLRVLWA